MTSTRKLLLVITKHTKHTIHTCTNINSTIITKSVQIDKIKSIKILSSHNIQNCTLSSTTIHGSRCIDDESREHPIISILNGCRSLRDCYDIIINEEEYIELLNNDNSTYSYQHHKYFILKLIERASKDQYLSWQMVFNIIQFYSNFHHIYNVPIESIYNFLSILSRRGDFIAVSSIIERLMPKDDTLDHKLPILSINNQLFSLLIQSLRIGGQSERGYNVFQQAINEFNLEPSIPFLLQGYMCNPSKWKFNFIALLNQYNLQCDQITYNETIKFHLTCIVNECQQIKKLKNSDQKWLKFQFDDINTYKLPTNIANEYNAMDIDNINNNNNMDNISSEDILNRIQLHAQRVLFYLNHANASNYNLNTEIFSKIIATSFDYMLHNKLSSMSIENENNFSKWINKYIKHIIMEQFRNHTQSQTLWKSELSTLLPLIFEGCLNRNQVQLSRDIWQLCETYDIAIDEESDKYYNDLSIRHFVRHGKRPPQNTKNTQQKISQFKDSDLKISVFPGDASSNSSGLPQPHHECIELAKNLMDRAPKIAASMDVYSMNMPSYDTQDNIILAKQSQPRSKKLFLTDMENAITLCRKYNDIISGRMLYQAFIDSKLSFKQHAAMATDFLFLLDYPQFRKYIISGLTHDNTENSLIITPQDVMTLWPLNPPQPFINKAFTVLITYKNAEGIKKLFDTVTLQSLQHNKKRLSLSPKMLILGSDIFATQCEKAEDLMDNIYWDYLWRLMENKHFKSARTENSVSYIGNKLLNILFNVNGKELSEDEVMINIKRIYNTFKNYNLPLPLPLMQKLHANLSNSLHKSWIRTIFIEEHHPNLSQLKINDNECDGLIPLQSSMHIMNDYRWYIDGELFNKSLENGLYENLKPLRKLMIDGTIPASHRLIHRILITFSKSNHLYLPELQQFLTECQAHYQHAFSPKEKSLIAGMIKRYINMNNINNINDDHDVSSIVSYLQSINISVHNNNTNNINNTHYNKRRKEGQSYIKYINPSSNIPIMSDSIRFNIGEVVQLCGLEKYSYLNGNIGTVVGWFNKETSTYPVQLNDNSHIVYVSPRNMRFGQHMINPILPEFNNNDDIKLIAPKSEVSENKISEPEISKSEITPFDTKQKKQHLRHKLLHILKDQKVDTFQNGISLIQLKELWNLYFPSEEFYHDDESLHDYVVMHIPLEVDYRWNIDQYPSEPLQRIYYLSQYDIKPEWKKLETLQDFLLYLHNLIEIQSNGRIRLKDLCTTCYSDIYESHKTIRKSKCVNILHFLKHHDNEFHIDEINGEKYISLQSQSTVDIENEDITQWTVYDIQYWLWRLYQDTKQNNNNIPISEWNVILGLFEGHHIDGNAFINLNESDLCKMNINSIGIQKLILSFIQKLKPTPTAIPAFETESEDIEEPLFTESEDCMQIQNVSQCDDTLSDKNFCECLLNYHMKFPSDDNYIYEHDILEYYDMNEEHQWFVQHLINYYYDKFNINYYDYNDECKYIKINMREEMSMLDINDEDLKWKIKEIVQQHPIGIDIVSLLHQYQFKYNGKMFKHNKKYESLTERLKKLDFIITTCSSGYIVFDSYS